MEPAIITLGMRAIDERLRPLAGEFGWSLVQVPAARQVPKIYNNFDVVAILFEPRALAPSWQEALRIVREAAPRALPIVCQRFSESLPWPELARAGAFHEVWLPFDLGEVRQSWGFVHSARLRLGARLTPFQGSVQSSFVA